MQRCATVVSPMARCAIRATLLLGVALLASPAVALRYSAVPIGVFQGTAYAIGPDGTVVGTGYGPQVNLQGFVADGSGVHFIQPDNTNGSSANAINATGAIAGLAGFGPPTKPPLSTNAFVWAHGVFTFPATLGGNFAGASGINDAGQVTGTSTLAGDTTSHAFLVAEGTTRDLGTLGGANSFATGINNSGQVVGAADTAGTPPTRHAFILVGGMLQDLGTLGGANSVANAVNAIGQVAGSADAGPGLTHAFLYTAGALHDLGSLGGGYAEAFGINSAGQVVGTSFPPSTAQGDSPHAFLYTDGAMLDLNALLAPSLGNVVLMSAIAINDAGQVVAEGCNTSTHDCQPYLLTQVTDVAARVRVVEFYYATFDHYFMTSEPGEIALLDAAQPPFDGWRRTGFSFLAYAPATAPSSTVAVCRFFNDSFASKSSHFFAAKGLDCEATLAHFPDWQLERDDAFNAALPDSSGHCPDGNAPVYRVYNDGAGGAPNHRFLVDLDERNRMLQHRWVAEGAGPGVAMCAAPI